MNRRPLGDAESTSDVVACRKNFCVAEESDTHLAAIADAPLASERRCSAKR
jgi:hypothetical protein